MLHALWLLEITIRQGQAKVRFAANVENHVREIELCPNVWGWANPPEFLQDYVASSGRYEQRQR